MPLSETPEDALTPEEVIAQLEGLSAADLKRAACLAKMCAGGLPGMDAGDLLQEAMVKLMVGERVWRRGVHPLVTLKMVMLSIAFDARKRAKGAINWLAVTNDGTTMRDEDPPSGAPLRDDRSPAEIVDGRSQLKYIESLVADDADATLVVTAWGLGMRGAEAAQETELGMNRYEAARKRLTKKLEPLAALRKTT
jgi:DNA-directed RNA polymerase specialized sigma24 family protein